MIRELIVLALAWMGAVFVLLSAVGMLRMPDLFSRLHASSKAATLGVASILLAAAAHFGDSSIWFRSAALIGFLFLTVPIATHLIARAGFRTGVEIAEETILNEAPASMRSEARAAPGMDPDLHSSTTMVREARVREVLALDEADWLDERGVYPSRPVDELADGPRRPAPMPPGEILLGTEWLSDVDLEHYFTDDPVLGAALPRGRVKRLDVDPRVLVFEDIPEPSLRRGPVVPSRNAWVMDTRGDDPVAMVVAAGTHDVVFWAERGNVRVYTLRKRR